MVSNRPFLAFGLTSNSITTGEDSISRCGDILDLDVEGVGVAGAWGMLVTSGVVVSGLTAGNASEYRRLLVVSLLLLDSGRSSELSSGQKSESEDAAAEPLTWAPK